MVPEHLAVVRAEQDHPGPFRLTATLLELGDERRNQVVQLLDEAEIAGLGRAERVALQQHAMPGFIAFG